MWEVSSVKRGLLFFYNDCRCPPNKDLQAISVLDRQREYLRR